MPILAGERHGAMEANGSDMVPWKQMEEDKPTWSPKPNLGCPYHTLKATKRRYQLLSSVTLFVLVTTAGTIERPMAIWAQRGL